MEDVSHSVSSIKLESFHYFILLRHSNVIRFDFDYATVLYIVDHLVISAGVTPVSMFEDTFDVDNFSLAMVIIHNQ